MPGKIRTLAAGAALALATATAGSAGSAAPANRDAACDRSCLRGLLDRYLDAAFKHDASAAPLAASYRGTENATDVKAGEGIWRTATGYGQVQRRYLDPVSGQAAYYGMLKEGDETDIVSVRIKVERRKITEGEWTIARKAYGSLNVDGLAQYPPRPETILPPAERAPRAQMIAAADAYFQGLQDHDGSKVPHVPGCERVENGGRVTNRPRPNRAAGAPAQPIAPVPFGQPTLASEELAGDCAADFAMFQRTILETVKRRFPVVDEEAGVVLGSTLFHRPPGVTQKRNLLTEFFYERGGKISGIWAAMYYLDPAAPDRTGWDAESLAEAKINTERGAQ